MGKAAKSEQARARAIAARERRALQTPMQVIPDPDSVGNFTVQNGRRSYQVHIGQTTCLDTCSCEDFGSTDLGMCKHTAHVRQVWMASEQGQKYLAANGIHREIPIRETVTSASVTLRFLSGAVASVSDGGGRCTCGKENCRHLDMAWTTFAVEHGLRRLKRTTHAEPILDQAILRALAAPFDAPVTWQAQQIAGNRALAVPVVDVQYYVDRLNQVVGGGWTDEYEIHADGAVILCTLTVCGVTRSDVGESTNNNPDAITQAFKCAFKRACAKFGLGVYLYRLKRWEEYDSHDFTPQAKARLQAAIPPLDATALQILQSKVLTLGATWGWDNDTVRRVVAKKLGKDWSEATAADLARIATDMARARRNGQRQAV